MTDDPIVRTIRKTPALRREDNTELARIVAKGGVAGEQARDKMIAGNMRLVLIFARKYPDGSLTLHDRIQEGAVGLMRAVAKYDPERGISFATYASFWIRASIERAFFANEHLIAVPSNVAIAMRRMAKAEANISRSLTAEETEEILHLGPSTVAAIKLLPKGLVPLDAPVTIDADTLVVETLIDDYVENLTFNLELTDVYRALTQCPDVTERDKTMIGLFAFGETYADIGETYALSRERVRQLVSNALHKLRNFLMR